MSYVMAVFAACDDSSSAFNGLFVYQWQDREKPKNVPCPQGKSSFNDTCVRVHYARTSQFTPPAATRLDRRVASRRAESW